MNDYRVLLLLGFLFLASLAMSPTPTATPDMSKISQADIEATIVHRNALNQQLLDQTLPAASNDVVQAVQEAQGLQVKIDALAKTAGQVPILQADLAKAHKAIWRDIGVTAIVCLTIGALGVLVGPTLIKLLPLASI